MKTRLSSIWTVLLLLILLVTPFCFSDAVPAAEQVATKNSEAAAVDTKILWLQNVEVIAAERNGQQWTKIIVYGREAKDLSEAFNNARLVVYESQHIMVYLNFGEQQL